MGNIGNYVGRFRLMVSKLRERPDIEVDWFHERPPATEEELERAAEYHPLASGMRPFYRQANGLKLEWSYVGDKFEELGDHLGQSVKGSIDILPINKTFKDHRHSVYFEEGDRFSKLHPLDRFAPEACSALSFDGTDDPPVHYLYSGEDHRSLEVGFREYLELLLESRGFSYWPSAVAPSWHPGTAVSTVEAEFRLIAPELWNDFDNDNFVCRDGSKPDLDEIERLVERGGGTADLDEYKYIRARRAEAG